MVSGKFRVAICGGGIGGLSLAVALSKYPDIIVDIYEAASAFAELGAGIGIWPRIWKVLDSLGLGEDLARETAVKPNFDLADTFILRKSDQPKGINFYKLQTQGNFLRCRRPELQKVLMAHLPPSYHTYFSHRLQTYTEEPSGKITLSFENGAAYHCDILVGADGIKSAVRRTMLTIKAKRASAAGDLREAKELIDSIEPVWTGIIGYRSVVPAERLRKYKKAHPDMEIRVPEANSIPMMYMGQHVNIVVYPLSGGRLINVGAYHEHEELAGTPWNGPWVENIEKDELLEVHSHWETPVRAILDCMEKPSRWAIHASQPLNTWVSGNVVLLGDSAHAMSPQQAAAGGQAIEDGFMLATLLGHRLTKLSNVHRALSIYDQIQRPMAMKVADGSIVNGRLFGLQLPGVRLSEHPERLPELGDAIKENWRWAWTTTVDVSVNEAMRRLENANGPQAHL